MENNYSIINQNRTLTSKVFDIWKDFCKWICGHQNLYECLIKIKNAILNNKIIVYYLILVYYLYKPDKQ